MQQVVKGGHVLLKIDFKVKALLVDIVVKSFFDSTFSKIVVYSLTGLEKTFAQAIS
jgi:hypothetical protein